MLRGINGRGTHFKDTYLEFYASSVTYVTVGAPLVIFAGGLMTHDKNLQRDAAFIAGSYLLSGGVTTLLKRTFKRQRPYDTYSFIVKRDDEAGGYSFPSGHTSSAFSLATSLSLRYPKWQVIVPSYFYAASVAWARMYQGVHYPSDVLAGPWWDRHLRILVTVCRRQLKKNHPGFIMKTKQLFLCSLLLLVHAGICAQDTLAVPLADTMPAYARPYYEKPRHFAFITHIPSDVATYARESFKKENLYKVGIVAGSTIVLWLADRHIADGWQHACRQLNIEAEQKNRALISVNIGGKKTTIGKLPKNINTAIYNLGQGSTTMLLAAGFFVSGKIKKDNRALQTASQLTQAFITLGIGTQLMKFSTGRETPSSASSERGAWRPFPGWQAFQTDKPKYDAFPSGHLATFISTVTIISSNYPEKKWIRPVGYSIAGLCSLAMINNGVHWASDYPLGFALGYGVGKYISKKNQKVPYKPQL